MNALHMDHIAKLADSVAGHSIPMAVVDYAGRADGEGAITEESPPERRYGTRSMSDVKAYGFKPLRWNAAYARKL